ncbi:hypothetical protein, partial [Coprococcus comes]|uniref:hypothetical protein n=3 Tax=Coprococcus TaxID=33042 RepID=UPI00356AB015
FYAKLFIFHPLCLCMPLLSLCLDQRTYGILPRLSEIVNVVFIFCAIQNILTSIQHAFANGAAEHPLPFAFPFPFSFHIYKKQPYQHSDTTACILKH